MFRRAVAAGVLAACWIACGKSESGPNIVQTTVSIIKAAGDSQTGQVGTALADPVQVRVEDGSGSPLPGATVTFAIAAGNGSVANASLTTGSDGNAATTWTLGKVAGGAQKLSVATQGHSVLFSATAVAGPPDSLVKVSGDNQSAAAGAALPESLVVRVADRFGNPVQGHPIAWAVTGGGGTVSPDTSLTQSSGKAATRWTLGPTVGAQSAQAAATGVTTGSPAPFMATGVSGSISVYEGDGQTGLVGYGLNVIPAVIVKDTDGNPVSGVAVTFAVAGGGGSVTGSVQITGSAGIARVGKWTLGTSPGPNAMTATATGLGFAGNPVQFSATGVTAQYHIDLRYLKQFNAVQERAFDSAGAHWERLIYGNLPSVPVSRSISCPDTTVTVNETVDDVVILVHVKKIDGPGGVLAQAGPALVRDPGKQAVVGCMLMDSDDLDNLQTNGQLEDVITHEMGHVLGFGSVWDLLGLLQNPSDSNVPRDTYFSGDHAIRAFNDLGGTSYTGNKVPVENMYGEGTRNAHWRESVFGNELMTGFISAPGNPNPLSSMTVASFWDEGYTVNLDGADVYVHSFSAPPAGAALRAAGAVQLVDDVISGPIYVVDAGGRVLRVIHPLSARR